MVTVDQMKSAWEDSCNKKSLLLTSDQRFVQHSCLRTRSKGYSMLY
ncbi:hypothetical protein V144x_17530 [Gimesia aquarii]|uniref:Uncharacterized protein n=1 Tax=Gimesia aquarii TaxID=2527964 RepID=A0A517VTK5_9PLAN|nr:hypothetical protein V144x_17530 [Gimesia aquarii]